MVPFCLFFVFFFFFLMIRRPPRSTLFPYTRSSDLGRASHQLDGSVQKQNRQQDDEVGRSEEHTSELKSRQYLVCRLLLEKKKTNENRCIRTAQNNCENNQQQKNREP